MIREPAVVVRLRTIRSESDRGSKIGDRVAVVALRRVNEATIVVGLSVVRGKANHVRVVRDRLVILALFRYAVRDYQTLLADSG